MALQSCFNRPHRRLPERDALLVHIPRISATQPTGMLPPSERSDARAGRPYTAGAGLGPVDCRLRMDSPEMSQRCGS